MVFGVCTSQELKRFEPGTLRFDSLREVIINTQGFDEGAAFKDNSGLYHFETWYDFSDFIPNFDLEAGVTIGSMIRNQEEIFCGYSG